MYCASALLDGCRPRMSTVRRSFQAMQLESSSDLVAPACEVQVLSWCKPFAADQLSQVGIRNCNAPEQASASAIERHWQRHCILWRGLMTFSSMHAGLQYRIKVLPRAGAGIREQAVDLGPLLLLKEAMQ